VTPEAVQLVAGLNSELLPQKSKQRYIGQFFLTKVCNNYSLIHKFLINHILLQTVLLIGVCGACLRKELYNGCFFKFGVEVGVELSIVNELYRLRITDQLFKSYALHEWCDLNRLSNAYFDAKFKKTPFTLKMENVKRRYYIDN
jgi:hypothetical protein